MCRGESCDSLAFGRTDAKGQRCSSARVEHRPWNGPWQVNAKREKSRLPSNLISIRPRALETKRGIQTIVRRKARHCLHPQNGQICPKTVRPGDSMYSDMTAVVDTSGPGCGDACVREPSLTTRGSIDCSGIRASLGHPLPCQGIPFPKEAQPAVDVPSARTVGRIRYTNGEDGLRPG